MVSCPICEKPVREVDINRHIDSSCESFLDEPAPPATQINGTQAKSSKAAAFFTPATKRSVSFKDEVANASPSPAVNGFGASLHTPTIKAPPSTAPAPVNGVKRSAEQFGEQSPGGDEKHDTSPKPTKKQKNNSHAPLAERMRPQSLDDVAGQDLVGPNGILRNLIVSDRIPSMILWGGPGTGKTTIARLIAQTAGARFVEINSTSSGVAECKKLFTEARNELGLTGRKTIIFCDEIHRFSKSQQDVFLGPVESGTVTLIGATTENPSFKVVNALLSRCRVFTLAKLAVEDVLDVLRRALAREMEAKGLHMPASSPSLTEKVEEEEEEENVVPNGSASGSTQRPSYHLLTDDNHALLRYLADFADGDARTALNLLELALDLCEKSSITLDEIKNSLTQTLVYDRAGDQHYDTISAFHKSVRGSHADAALYYLARMLQSGEDALYIARRMCVIASEDVGLADNTLLPLAMATYTACEKIGMPECRINLAHCTVALCLAPKSTRAYRGLNAAYSALAEPGVAGLPIPIHLRNAPTRLMKEMGYGKEYKYNPDFVDGRVVQEYFPEKLEGRRFLGTRDLGEKVDPEIVELDEQVRIAEQYDPVAEDVLLGPDGD